MKAIKTMTLAGASIAAGVLAAFAAAPAAHDHGNPSERLVAMWAHHYSSVGEMTADADAVVLGKIVQTVPGRTVEFADGRPALPFTYVDVDVTEILRGDAPSYLTVEQTGGGFLGDRVYFEDDGGAYTQGGEVLLFLKQQPGTGLFYVSHPAGRFDVREGRLVAVLPDDATAQALDGRSVEAAREMIRD